MKENIQIMKCCCGFIGESVDRDVKENIQIRAWDGLVMISDITFFNFAI